MSGDSNKKKRNCYKMSKISLTRIRGGHVIYTRERERELKTRVRSEHLRENGIIGCQFILPFTGSDPDRTTLTRRRRWRGLELDRARNYYLTKENNYNKRGFVRKRRI